MAPPDTLALQANDQGWRLFLLRRDDPKFKQFAKKVLERDNYTCIYCGFKSRYGQEIINRNGNYTSNKISNMATACLYCAQCQFIQAIGDSGFGGGVLIYLPQMSQVQLNSLAHCIFCDLANSVAGYSHAKVVYRELKLCAQTVESDLGEGLSDPANYGKLLIEHASSKLDDFHSKAMESIRLLPRIEKAVSQIQQYSLEAFDEFAVE